ncbi:hypothetical protein B0H66DRAFT_604128 [Apodospora peruviana]|uniref:Fucose-specific lectin n=1 Tax=Apodospora peruviana TaxID=516989 RepID=A0AAE0HZM3_9PEZI|nr:hypothetical protein B0H66DRAFT_604128 [Apodospora peruviana]
MQQNPIVGSYPPYPNASELPTDRATDHDTYKVAVGWSSLEPVDLYATNKGPFYWDVNQPVSNLEPVNHSNKELASLSNPEVLENKAPHELALHSVTGDSPSSQNHTFWPRRKRWWIVGGCGFLLVLIVGLTVGLVLGTKSSEYTTEDSNGSGNTPPANVTTTSSVISCDFKDSQIHRHILSAAALDSTLHIFARGKDKDIWFRSLEGQDATWTGPWKQLLGGGEAFAGPPTAITWQSSRINVFAPSTKGSNVLTAGYQSGAWTQNWENLGESVSTPVALCDLPEHLEHGATASTPERIDQWVVSQVTGSVIHNLWNPEVNDFDQPANGEAWDATMDGLASASMPGIVCSANDPAHSLLVYANGTDSVRLRHYQYETGAWDPWIDLGGRFRGDPVLMRTGGREQGGFNFFGVGMDGAMYTFNWTNATGLAYRPPITSLGGNFSSVPSAVVTGHRPLQIDVVALGVDGKIKHRAFRSGRWEDTWEDLGVEGMSAPLVVNYEVLSGSAAVNRTVVAFIGKGDQLQFASWESTENAAWKDLARWTGGGGNLTLDAMCLDP